MFDPRAAGSDLTLGGVTQLAGAGLPGQAQLERPLVG
jgi:hypothetical protein